MLLKPSNLNRLLQNLLTTTTKQIPAVILHQSYIWTTNRGLHHHHHQSAVNIPLRRQHSLPSNKAPKDDDYDNNVENVRTSGGEGEMRKNYRNKPYNPVDLATSLDYIKSDVYQSIYRGKPVWFYYRRNFRGHFAPPRTRPNCVMVKKLISSNPCPICRDEYLVLDYRHTELLKQFINPVSGQILEPTKTGLCQHQHKQLLLEIEKAQDIGTIEMWLPFHLYDYTNYYANLPADQLDELLRISDCPSSVTNPDDHRVTSPAASSSVIATLPSNLQTLLQSVHVIPDAAATLDRSTNAPSSARSADETEQMMVERPKIPNRYRMEEEYKSRVARRRKSRSLLLE